jgi:tetratricopeptide (TPR) repeat protein
MNVRLLLPIVIAALAWSAVPAQAQSTPDQINSLLTEAQSLQGRKRFLDAFAKLDEAEKIDPKRGEIYNIRGAIYLAAQVRDVDKARAEFTKARALHPDAMPPQFNLAETDFVSAKWPDAEKSFGALLTTFPKLPSNVRHLVIFKVLVSQVKQDKLDEAEKTLADNFTFMDDTPAYYFAKAVIALQRKDERSGNDWLTKAQIIFKQRETSSYLDSMMESHYIDSLSVTKPEESAK